MGITIVFRFPKNNFTLKLRYEVILSANKMLIAGEKMLLRNCFLDNCGDGEETLCLLRCRLEDRSVLVATHRQYWRKGKKTKINPECHNDSLT